MDDQYGMPDLRHYITSSRPLFPHPPPDLLTPHRPPPPPNHPYDNMLLFPSDSPTTLTPANTTGFAGFESGLNVGGGDGGAGRWPRQETLTLLEIRSRLDPKFKEANQKGPLWDEVSRIMSEEHGYQRSGKKCREKFENLYKYYKKTKEGKAGRQDGKHYRFFRQLEALYGDSNSAASGSDQANLVGGNFHYNYGNKSTSLGPNQESFQGQKLSDNSLSLSNYSDEVDTSSSDDTDLNEGNDKNDDPSNKKRGKRGWKVKIRDFIDSQMKKLMDKQEIWMEKMMKTMEEKEHERMMREEEWRRQDAVRMEKEQKFWANERAWIEARDAALMEALHKLTGKDNHHLIRASPAEIENQNNNNEEIGGETMTNSGKGGGNMIWPESEISRLIQVRSGMEAKFQQIGVSSSSSSEEMLWEEIATKMACHGHDRTGVMCKDKWDSVNNNYLLKCNKKRKENSKGCSTAAYYHEQVSNQLGQDGDHVYSCNEASHDQQQQQQTSVDDHHRRRHANSSPSANTGNNAMTTDSCFRFFMGDAYGRIMD